MDGQEKHRFVQQYVEQQKAYIPLYATEGPPNERHTPSRPIPALPSDEFGFDTPILRPRVSKVMNPVPSPSRRQERSADPPRPKSPSKTKAPSDKEASSHKPTSKRHPTPDSHDTGDERAARLADRRERKRKKRAIVNPKHEESTTPVSRAKVQKAKKPAAPAALALMYGFSATNITKDRLTVKPAPFGVFSKGKASSKKKTSATKKSTSKKELFSESAFLNKSSVLASKVAGTEDSSSDSSLPLVSARPAPKKPRATKEKHAPLQKGREAPTSKTPQGLARASAGSEIWDIELQSNLPSSVPEVRSERGAKGTASVVLDLQGAKWSVPVMAAEEHDRKVSAVQEQSKGPTIGHSSVLVRSHSSDDRRPRNRDTDTSTILPCHSASQVGRLAVDIQPSAPRLVTSKYFIAPLSVQQEAAVIDVDRPQVLNSATPHPLIHNEAHLPKISNSSLDAPHRPISEQHIEDAPLDARTAHGVESPLNSLISLPQPVLAFRTPYDSIAPLEFEFSSDSPPYPPYDDLYDQYPDTPQEPQVRPSDPDYEPQVWGASSSDVLGFHDPLWGETRDSFRPLTMSYLSPAPAHEYLPAEVCEDAYESIEPQYVYGQEEEIFEDGVDCQYDTCLPGIFQPQNGDEESYHSERDPDDMTRYERDTIDASIQYHTASEEDPSLGESEDEVEVPEFLEGRALLLGISDQQHQIQMLPNARLSGLLQAEMDVASRLRDHWRPVRL